jgi:hypothetical protein
MFQVREVCPHAFAILRITRTGMTVKGMFLNPAMNTGKCILVSLGTNPKVQEVLQDHHTARVEGK